MNLSSILLSLAVGALVGWIAGMIMKSHGGLIRNIVVGIIGSFVGSWIAGLLGISGGGAFSLVGLLISIGGACVLIWLCRFILGKRH